MRGLFPSLRRVFLGDPEPTRRGPADDFWYREPGAAGVTAGQSVTADSSLTIGAVYRAVNILANSAAMLPLHVYRRVEGGKQRDDDHAVAELFLAPNPWQTSFEFRRNMWGHVLLRGNAYALIVPRRDGHPLGALLLLHPGRMRVEQLADFRKRYTYRWQNGVERTYTQDEILHVTALSMDGLCGLAPVSLMRTTLGTSMAMRDYGARQFTQQPKISGVLTTPHELDDEAHERMEQSFRAAWSGASNWFGVPLLEQDTKWQQVGMNNADAEFLASRQFSVVEIGTWFGVPPHMLGDASRATWNNIESFGIEFVTFSVLPWLVNFEQRAWRDLLLEDRAYFVEHVVDMLLRGDGTSRAARQVQYLQHGVLNPDEVRAQENWNPREDGRGGTYLESVNAARPLGPPAPPAARTPEQES